jgi:hypothetical protein
MHSISPEGLSRRAYSRFDTAQMRTAWGRHHQRRFALVDGADVLASATRYDLTAVLDQQPVRVCGIGSLFSERDGGHAREFVDRLLDEAVRDGAVMALRFSEMRQQDCEPDGFEMVPMVEAELTVAESLHFFIAEEGITAAAYVVVSIVGRTWTIEECGDRDPSGARVGATLQALIAREPVERRPTIRAWLPRGFVPPQVTIVSAKPAAEVLMVRSLGSVAVTPRLSGDDVLYWRSDIL